jgi:glycine/D-amino acid oxidase-like deaminating enzyme
VGELAENQFIIAGFNGHGMPLCFLSGKALACLVAGEVLPPEFPTSFLVSPERLESGNTDDFDSTL